MPAEHPFADFIIQEKELPDKTILIKEGSQSNHVFVIMEGQVKVKKETEKGLVTLESLKAGSIIGERSALEQSDRTRGASVVTDGPVRIGVIDKNKLKKAIAGLPSEVRDLFYSLYFSLNKENHRVASLARTLMG